MAPRKLKVTFVALVIFLIGWFCLRLSSGKVCSVEAQTPASPGCSGEMQTQALQIRICILTGFEKIYTHLPSSLPSAASESSLMVPSILCDLKLCRGPLSCFLTETFRVLWKSSLVLHPPRQRSPWPSLSAGHSIPLCSSWASSRTLQHP